MLINVDDEQNKIVENILDEGILTITNQISQNKKIMQRKKKKKLFNPKNNKRFNSIKVDENINNNEGKNNFNFIIYSGKTGELINNTITALNMGLNQYPKNRISIYNSNINKSSKKGSKNSLTKKTQINLTKRNNNISNKFKNIIPNVKKAFINTNKIPNNNKKIKNTLTKERNLQTYFDSLIENNSTNDNSNNIIKNNKNKIHLFKKDCEEKCQKDKRYLTLNGLYKKSKSLNPKNHKLKEQYEETISECDAIKKKIKEMRNENRNAESRIKDVNNKSNNLKQIKNKTLKIQKNLDQLTKIYSYNENIKLKQINLMQKLANEIGNLKNISKNL